MTQLDLLEPRCKVPDRGTQCYELLMAMKRGVRLTIWNAMAEYRCGALHQRIKDLREMGWPIQRQEIKVARTKVAEFWL
jgi:hypothetical protein